MHAWFNRNEKLSKPRALLPELLQTPSGIWLDAACGDGVFAQALLEISTPRTYVIGMDEDFGSLRRFQAALQPEHSSASAIVGDLRNPLPLLGLDGILIANSLHFFRETVQMQILKAFKRALVENGQLVIVEYNTERGTGPVPFPLPLERMNKLLTRTGFQPAVKVTTVPSSYLGEMYALLTCPAGRIQQPEVQPST